VDIAPRMIEMARQARYGDYSVRFVPEKLKAKYFSITDNSYEFNPEYRERVDFRQMNLVDLGVQLAGRQFDLVFCRYVLIYFDLEAKRRTIAAIESLLYPGGYLFLGNSEALLNVTDAFKLLHLPAAIVFCKESKK